MIKISTLSVPADAEPGTLVTLLSNVDRRGRPIPSRYVLAVPGLFAIAGDALLTGNWDSPPAPGNYTAHVAAFALAGNTAAGSSAVVVNIIPGIGGSIWVTPPGGVAVKGYPPGAMIIVPHG